LLFRGTILDLDRRAALLVEDAEVQVEAAQQLDEPLVDEVLRDQHEDALGAPGEEERVQHEARLDRLSEADLVGEKDARRLAPRHLARDEELVRQERDARPSEAPHRRRPPLVQPPKRLLAELEEADGVEGAPPQALERPLYAEQRAQVVFRDPPRLGRIDEKPVLLRDLLHDQAAPVAGSDDVATVE